MTVALGYVEEKWCLYWSELPSEGADPRCVVMVRGYCIGRPSVGKSDNLVRYVGNEGSYSTLVWRAQVKRRIQLSEGVNI